MQPYPFIYMITGIVSQQIIAKETLEKDVYLLRKMAKLVSIVCNVAVIVGWPAALVMWTFA